MQSLSKSEIDRLGDRLREAVSPEDLRLLDEYRKSFAPSYQSVVTAVRARSELPVSGRPAKSTTAIVDKLRRESIRLSQMQDIAGCRVVVADGTQQHLIANPLVADFPNSVAFDRRGKSSHGYRAVHLVVPSGSHQVEIQIRTELQHIWAELSEKFADKFGIAIKYGGGDPTIRQELDSFSAGISQIELLESLVTPEPMTSGVIEQHKAHLRKMMLDFLTAVESENDLSD